MEGRFPRGKPLPLLLCIQQINVSESYGMFAASMSRGGHSSYASACEPPNSYVKVVISQNIQFGQKGSRTALWGFALGCICLKRVLKRDGFALSTWGNLQSPLGTDMMILEPNSTISTGVLSVVPSYYTFRLQDFIMITTSTLRNTEQLPSKPSEYITISNSGDRQDQDCIQYLLGY